METLKATVVYDASRTEWVIFIHGANSLLDVGCEATKSDADAWAKKALTAYTESPGPHVIPDMYDRRALN